MGDEVVDLVSFLAEAFVFCCFWAFGVFPDFVLATSVPFLLPFGESVRPCVMVQRVKTLNNTRTCAVRIECRNEDNTHRVKTTHTDPPFSISDAGRIFT